MKKVRGTWVSSGSGFYTRDKSTSDSAVSIATRNRTSPTERQQYAKDVNSRASNAFRGILKNPKLKVG